MTHICSVPHCGRRVHARGLCVPHYGRWRRHGDPTKVVAPFNSRRYNPTDVVAAASEKIVQIAGPQPAPTPTFLNPAPFAVTYTHTAPPVAGDIITGVIYGDTHGQFLDPSAEAILRAVVMAARPDVVVHLGDAVDCYTISDFDKDPTRKDTLQTEIDAARAHLARVRAAAPDASFFLLEGNHEDRLRRALWRSAASMREVVKLREFQAAIQWPRLLALDQLGITWVPTVQQPLVDVFPKFLVKHGEVVRKWSGWSAKGEWERYGKSGASGHTHRLAMFLHRDWNGNHAWVETGCLCGLQPDYDRDPDWQQGFVVVTFEVATGAFQLEPVYIHNGSAVWRGNIYRSTDYAGSPA